MRLVRLVQEAEIARTEGNMAKRQGTSRASQTTTENGPTGKISKNLSSPVSKNIPLNTSGKSPLQARPVPPG